MNKTGIKCIVCAAQTQEAKDIVITSRAQSREIAIMGLTGMRCHECGEQYVDAKSSRKALEIANKRRAHDRDTRRDRPGTGEEREC